MVKGKHCYICGKDVEIKGSMKDHQNEEHKEDLAKIKISNSMEDVVRTYCKVVNEGTGQPCGKSLKVTDVRNHTKKVHNMVITDYKNKYDQHHYDLIELILHKCGICEEYVLLDSDEVAKHLKMKTPVNHDITHGNYNAKFMKLNGHSSCPKNPKPKASTMVPSTNAILEKGKTEKGKTKATIKPYSKESVTPNPENTFIHPPFSHPLSKSTKTPPGPVFNKLPQSVPLKESIQFTREETEGSVEELLSQEPDPSVTVGSFRALLDSLSEDGEQLRFPDLEMILNLNI